jgi:murein L,D-transpeptidase YafK
MLIRNFILAVSAAVLLACSGAPRFLHYDGPEVTRVVVHKAERRMELWHHDELLRVFRVQLGRNPVGHKVMQGDGRTPEGDYIVDRRNPRSAFHLSLGINYPRPEDVEVARMLGVNPGGDIFIHGRGPNHRWARGDWTEGCIAVRDREIEVIYAMVRDGTPVTILP